MLPYTPAQFVARSLRVPTGQCIHCGAPTERDTEPGRFSGGYSSTCSRCFWLGQEAFKLGHSHMFQHPDGYIAASGAERNAWATSVRMAPAFVSGKHVGWYCPGAHGDDACGWAPTHDEVQEILDAWGK